MKTFILLAMRFYPRAWRGRYGAEFEALLDEEPGTLRVLFDVVRGATACRSRTWINWVATGGIDVMIRANAERYGALGLAVMLPTAILMALAVLKYIVGVSGPFDAVEPTMTPIVTHPLGETLFVLGPYIALALAVVPITRVALGWARGRVTASVEFSAPVLNIVVAMASLGLIVVMALYWVAENL